MKIKKAFIVLGITILVGIGVVFEKSKINSAKIVMGANYIKEVHEVGDREVDNIDEDYSLEKFFRPSKSPILNDKIEKSLYDSYGKKQNEINLPKELLKTPNDTILNYFSVLREAANPLDETNTGCGTMGDAKGPYPVAYNFLSNSYKERLTYKKYLKSFKNKLHMNLVKLNKVAPDKDRPNDLKYFVEIEVIEGSKEKKGLFAYYYGYIYLDEEDGVYKIKDMNFSPENYLCAPYHGWSYDAESFVEIEYGDWCSLIKGDVVVESDGYEKKVYFKDKDNNEYYVLFYTLTNGTDIKIADYKKNQDGKWEVVYIEPKNCLDKNKN